MAAGNDLRRHWQRLAAGTGLVLAGVLVAPHLVRTPALVENRALAEAPSWPKTLAELEALPRAIDAFVDDRLPARALLVAPLNALRLRLGSSGSSKVLVGRDGWLFYDDGSRLGPARGLPPLSEDAAAARLAVLAGRTEALAASNRTYVVLVAPLKETIYPEKAPRGFRPAPDRAAVTLSRLAVSTGAGAVVFPRLALARQAGFGLKVYSPHDTHWTGLGAYQAYAALMAELHMLGVADAPRPLDDFRQVRAGDPFAPHDLAGMLGVGGFVRLDYPEMADPPSETDLKVTYLSDRRDWAAPRVIDTGAVGKPVLLLVRDSFANALLPLLYVHFSRIVVVHHEAGAWREDLIARFSPDVVVSEVVESSLSTVLETGPSVRGDRLAALKAAVARDWRVEPAAAARAVGRASDGDDHILGGGDRDVVMARKGDDDVRGLAGDDVLRGGRGRDRLDGGDGADWLSGDIGDDVLTGGRGGDVFFAFPGSGADLITDFSVDEGDRVELEHGATYTLEQAGGDAIVRFRGGQITLRGLRLDQTPPGWIGVR